MKPRDIYKLIKNNKLIKLDLDEIKRSDKEYEYVYTPYVQYTEEVIDLNTFLPKKKFKIVKRR